MLDKNAKNKCPESLDEISEYLSREEAFEISPQDLKYVGYTKKDGTEYWVWEYLDEDKEQNFAIVYTIKVLWFFNSTCTGCWGNPDNVSPDELLAEYIEVNC